MPNYQPIDASPKSMDSSSEDNFAGDMEISYDAARPLTEENYCKTAEKFHSEVVSGFSSAESLRDYQSPCSLTIVSQEQVIEESLPPVTIPKSRNSVKNRPHKSGSPSKRGSYKVIGGNHRSVPWDNYPSGEPWFSMDNGGSVDADNFSEDISMDVPEDDDSDDDDEEELAFPIPFDAGNNSYIILSSDEETKQESSEDSDSMDLEEDSSYESMFQLYYHMVYSSSIIEDLPTLYDLPRCIVSVEPFDCDNTVPISRKTPRRKQRKSSKQELKETASLKRKFNPKDYPSFPKGPQSLCQDSIVIEEFEHSELPEPRYHEKSRTFFPKKYEVPLSEKAEKLLELVEKHLTTGIKVMNPFTTDRQSNKTLSEDSSNELMRFARRFLQIMNFPATMSLADLWWNLSRPATIKHCINLLQFEFFTKQSMRHHVENFYRINWLWSSPKFLNAVGLGKLKKSFISQVISLYGGFFRTYVARSIISGKKDTQKRRTKDELLKKKKWVEAETIIEAANEVYDDIDNSSSFDSVRSALIFLFFTLEPPVRTQNLNILFLDRPENSTDDAFAKDKVSKYNKEIMKKDKTSYKAKKVTGVIWSKKINGSYKVTWTDFKTSTAFDTVQRFYSEPKLVDVMTRYIKMRSVTCEVFLQYAIGTPFYKVSQSFMRTSKFYLDSDLDINTTRDVYSTEMKKTGTHNQYLNFCQLLLHSETVSNIHYYKTDSLSEQSECSRTLLGVLGSSNSGKIQATMDKVRDFLYDFESGDIDSKIDEISKVIDSFVDRNSDDDSGNSDDEDDSDKGSATPVSSPVPVAVSSKSPLAKFKVGERFACPKCRRSYGRGADLKRHLDSHK
mgnify:CR=1 FL=1